ncbi:MAG: hypothetical protein V5A61_11355 [Haloarculaceae archaeon]
MTDAEKPRWWSANEAVKASFDLPPYEPPRFADGTYTHDVVPDIEREFDCTIRFVGVDPRYPDDWEVRVDGEPLLEVGRRRDEHGNTVYGLTAEAFEARVREALGT